MLRERITDYSKGDDLRFFWALFRRREKTKSKLLKDIFSFLCSHSAHRHGGYIGRGARIAGIPFLPHGLHGIYLSRYADVGSNCRIYQNVTVGEVRHKAPQIGDNCFIGARSEVVEGVVVGHHSVIGMGVFLSQSTRIYNRATGEVTYGYVPPYSVVVSGSLPSKDGTHSLYCAVIVKQVDAKTRSKTSVNDLLRGLAD